VGAEGAPEVHATDTQTASLMGGSMRAHGERLQEFGDGYMNHIDDKITDQTGQDTYQMTEDDKKKKDLNDEFYNQIDNMVGVNDK